MNKWNQDQQFDLLFIIFSDLFFKRHDRYVTCQENRQKRQSHSWWKVEMLLSWLPWLWLWILVAPAGALYVIVCKYIGSIGRIDLYTPRVPSEPTLSTLWAHNENTKSILRVHSEYIQSTPWVHSEYSPSIFRAPTWAFCMPMCLYWYATQFFRLLLIQSSGFLKDIWRISLEYIWGYLGEIWCWFWWCTLREYMSEHTHVPRHAMVIFKRRVIMMLNILVGMRLRSTMKIIGRGQSNLQLKATAIMSGESIVNLNIHK